MPEQIEKHGSHCDAYPGKNCFRELKKFVNGTTHIARQIAKNSSINNIINKFLTTEEVNKIEDYRLKNLYLKLLKIKNQNHQYFSLTKARLINLKFCKLLPTYDLIKKDRIVTKCVLLINGNNYFISIFNDKHELMD